MAIINGGNGNDVLYGTTADDYLDGGTGADTLNGGIGYDTYVVDNVGDVVIEVDGFGVVQSSVSFSLSNNVDALILTGTAAINGTGNVGNNSLIGNEATNILIGEAGRDFLDGGAGADTLIGGTGDDTYVVDNAGDVVIEGGGEVDFYGWLIVNFDQVQSSVSYTLSNNVENLTLTGTAAINGTGNGLANVLTGNEAANILNGGVGSDTLNGGAGADTLIGEAGADILIGEAGADTLNGGAGADVLNGGAGADVLIGGIGAGILDGGAGADTLVGGTDNDRYYVDDVGDIVMEAADEGIDWVESSVSYILGDTIENLALTGTAAINGTGNGGNNVLIGNYEANFLDGGVGADTLDGGYGNDTYVVDNVGDIVKGGGQLVQSSVSYTLGANLANLTLTGTAAINGTGNSFSNVLTGNSAANILISAGGGDTLIGGAGSDTYVVTYDADVIIETSTLSTEIDTVMSVFGRTLGNNLENLIVTGLGADTLIGNSLTNHLTGNRASNLLNGEAGADTLVGGLGNDTYIVDNVGDVVTESSTLATEIDVVQSSVSYTLSNNLEKLILTGADAINGTGNSLANTLTGNDASNVLNGGAGADTLVGGLGNDTYVINSVVDVVTESSALLTEIDVVQSSVSYVLGNNLESLILTGTAALNGSGNGLANTLTGNVAGNRLDGGAGADTLVGGLGNDTYVVNLSGDVVIETSTLSTETDTVQSSSTYVLSANLENLVLTGTAATNGTGNSLANVLTGNGTDNRLDGGVGADTLAGGGGNDTYVVDNVADVVMEGSTLVTEMDTVQSSISYTLGTNLEKLSLTGAAAINGTGNALANTLTGNSAANVLTGDSGDDTLIGNAGADTLTGGSGNDLLDGGRSDDYLVGGLGNDTYVVDSVGDVVAENSTLATEVDLVQSSLSYTLGNNLENLMLTGTAAINGIGNSLANVLTGNSAVNRLNGGAGNDTYVVDNVGDIITESSTLATEIDVVQSRVSYTLGNNLENLMLTGAGAINGTGNALANTLTGNSAANLLNGGVGADTLVGDTGNDTYVVDNVGDIITESSTLATEMDVVRSIVSYTLSNNLENLILTGAGAINGTGNALANVLTGNSAANRLDGGAGADTLIGGTGNDTYIVETASDIVVETSTLSSETDTVQSLMTYTLGNNLERLILVGAGAISGFGNSLNNTITGNVAANFLNGLYGVDTLVGGAGNDTYVVDNVGDIITESSTLATEIDVVQSMVSYTLGNNLEKLTLIGADAINSTGNSLANTLTGNSAANLLNGGAGADTLIGGLGNDTYVVDNHSDVVIETSMLASEVDIVQSTINYTIGDNLEQLVLVGIGAINGTGNSLANTLTGNSAANVLNGGIGTDTLIGGLGNDTYVVDSFMDVVTETSTVGTELDTVQSSIHYILGANLENLTLTGTEAINGGGNELVNTLTGNSADNLLNGGGGADMLIGGEGNDTYVVDNSGDIITEVSTLAGEIDVVQSIVSYTLSNNLEDLMLTGTGAINGTGNALSNYLTGNSAANVLNGRNGNDALIGGAGNDTYVFARTDGVDTVMEYDRTAGNTDVLSFLGSVAHNQLWFRHNGNHLEVSIIGTTDKIWLQNWYSGSAQHVEQIKTVDGSKTLLDTKVESLVTAMASMTPPPLGQTSLTTAEHAQLDAVIAANWS
jgi:Ca2+-binding RTX toxin-like protein